MKFYNTTIKLMTALMIGSVATLASVNSFADESVKIVDITKFKCLRYNSNTAFVDLEKNLFGYNSNISASEMDPKSSFNIASVATDEKADVITFSVNGIIYKIAKGEGGRDGDGIKLDDLSNKYDSKYTCHEVKSTSGKADVGG
jgi:hypothetical protein